LPTESRTRAVARQVTVKQSSVPLVIADELEVIAGTVDVAYVFKRVKIRSSTVRTLYYPTDMEPDMPASSADLQPRPMAELVAMAITAAEA
jgi:hypothetical protein